MSAIAFHVQLVCLLNPRAGAVHVAVDQAHLGQALASLLEVRPLLQAKVAPLAGEAEDIPGDAWPSAIQGMVDQARAAFPTPAEISGGLDPLQTAQTAAQAIPGGADVVELAGGIVALQRPGRAGPDVLFYPLAGRGGAGGLN